MDKLDRWIASWRRAEERARIAEDRVVAAYADYAAGTGPLPLLVWETDAALSRAEASKRLETLYLAAKHIRKPTSAEFRSSIPDTMGGPGSD